MKRFFFVFALLTGLGLSIACWSQAPHGDYWVDRANQLELFRGREVTAIAFVDQRLYVSTGRKIFLVHADENSSIDLTERVKKRVADQITDILVDPVRNELWIVLNSNMLFASCYTVDLVPKDCPRAFLGQRTALIESLQESGPRSSVNALAVDAEQVIVAYFKDGIYLCSLQENWKKLVYKPSSPNNWGVSAVLTNNAGFVATRGDGLIVVDRKNATAVRFSDKDNNYIRSLAAHGQELYLGAKGLYRANIADYRRAP